MEQYKNIANRILADGVVAENRTGVKTLSTFGESMRFDLSQGFPAPTTKKGYFKGAVVELLWMLSGDTNVRFLNDHGVTFWNQWAIENEGQCMATVPMQYEDVAEVILELFNTPIEDVHSVMLKTYLESEDYTVRKLMPTPQRIAKAVTTRQGWKNTIHKRTCEVGDLGPLYGKMWRAFPNTDGTTTDQIQQLINNLRRNPTSRRHVVSTWCPSLLPDERLSPQENVAQGKMALAPCHWNFTVKVEHMSDDERLARYFKDLKTKYIKQLIQAEMKVAGGCIGRRGQEQLVLKHCPKYRLNLHVSLRSNDVPAGNPINVMFYALLTHMLADQVDMAVGELWLTATDAHVYEDQIEPLKEQLTREPYPLPKLSIQRLPDTIFDYKVEDFALVDYQYHPAIKFEVAK